MVIRCRFPPQLVGTHDLFGQAGEEALKQLDTDCGMLLQQSLQPPSGDAQQLSELCRRPAETEHTVGKAIFPQEAARREIRDLQRRGAAICFPVGNKPQLALENKTDLLIVVAAGEYGLMLIVGFYMAVIKENRMLLLSKTENIGSFANTARSSSRVSLRRCSLSR